MASISKTQNLKLNQWVLEDPFLMEDMNADNQKIDTAVQELQGQLDAVPYVKLMDITTAADASQVNLDLSSIDLTKYAKIQIISNAKTNGSGNGNYLYMRINNLQRGTLKNYDFSNATGYGVSCVAAFSQEESVGASSIEIEISGFRNQPNGNTHSDYKKAILVSSRGADFQKISGGIGVVYLGESTAVSSLNFFTNNSAQYVYAGSRFTVYGVRL